MKMNNKVTVRQDETKPIPVEILASSIVETAKGVKRINASALSRKALVVLLCDYTKYSKYQVEAVLRGLDELERMYLKKDSKRG